MQPFKYKPPRVNTGDLRTRVTFYIIEPKKSPMPSNDKVKNVVHECWSKVDQVWMKDIEMAKANGTLSDLTLTIRDTQGGFIPTNKHYIEIHAPEYKNVIFNVKEVMPDLQSRGFVKVISEVTSP